MAREAREVRAPGGREAPGGLERPRCSPTFPYPTRTLNTEVGHVAYFEHGRGPAMIFIHGLGGDLTHFEHLAPVFARHFRVIGIDLPGCGRSDKHGRQSLARHARAVMEVMRGLGIERATLVGHSAGGQVAAEVALCVPGKVERLVLINSAGLRSYHALLRLGARVLFHPAVLRRILGPSSMKLLARVFHSENAHTRAFRRGAMGRPREPLLGELCKVAHELMPDLLQPTVHDGAPEVTVPTLLIWGERDRLVPLSKVRAAAARFPRGQLAIIAECGHMPIIETPDETIALMQRFLQVQEGFGEFAAG